jgi:trehalose/maltose hydrolase-like predicted phosphorylase
MLFYLLSEKEIKRIVSQLHYAYKEDICLKTIQYYLKRTCHGSTLSRLVFSAILFKYDLNKATELFQEALISDLKDTQGGSTEESIHLGVMVGTTSVLIHTFAGVHIDKDVLCLDPHLPSWVHGLKFKLLFRQNLYAFEISQHTCCVRLIENQGTFFEVRIENQVIDLAKIREWKIDYLAIK